MGLSLGELAGLTPAQKSQKKRGPGNSTKVRSARKANTPDERPPFHNPFHFVPVSAEVFPGAVQVVDFTGRKLSQIQGKDYSLSHGVYSGLSGRLVCRLTTESPMFIGGEITEEANDNRSAKVESSLRPGTREPMIPGSSLRGLLAGIAEAASNSSLRVLTDTYTESKNKSGTPNPHSFFKSINGSLLPFGVDERPVLTIAELLLGFVEERTTPPGTSRSVPVAYASRVRVASGYLVCQENAEEPFSDEICLKVLDSPKPPSPNLYFKSNDPKNDGVYIPSKQLQTGIHQPQGRKLYLHQEPRHKSWITKCETGENAHLKQKARIRPWREGLTFVFHIDFDNLSEEELVLLCYAVRPSSSFRHKLGMGKPLGLGTVCIDPVGLFLIKRKERYSELPTSARYHGVFVSEDPSVWPDRYKKERDAAKGKRCGTEWFSNWRTKFKPMDEIGHALEILGDPKKMSAPVHYPQVAGIGVEDDEFENEHFRWFVKNDQLGSSGGASLKPIRISTTEIPTLPRHD